MQRNEYRRKLIHYLNTNNHTNSSSSDTKGLENEVSTITSSASESSAEKKEAMQDRKNAPTDAKVTIRDTILSELVQSFETKEKETVKTLEEYRERNGILNRRFESMYDLATQFKRILEDHNLVLFISCGDFFHFRAHFKTL